MASRTSVLLTFALLALTAQSCVAQTTSTYTTVLNLLTSLRTSPVYGTVATAVDAAGLAAPIATLANTTGVTILAPNNQAFVTLGAPIVNCLLNQPGLTLLRTVLQYHVIQGVFNSTAILAAAPVSLPAISGAQLNITRQGNSVFVNGVSVVAPDVAQQARAFVIHGLSSVLIPPGGLAAVQAYCSSAGCAPRPCGVGGTCVPTPAAASPYTCICSPAFQFNGGTCIPRPIEPYQTRF